MVRLDVFSTAFLVASVNAFSTPRSNPPMNPSAFVTGSSRSIKLFMADKKEGVGFDKATGQLADMEDEGECIPEDEYCVVDKKTGKLIRLTMEEKERIFLDALQTFYMSGRQLLSDDEFDLLKEDLQWSGSKKVVLNRKEARYLAATQAYLKGEPIMSDEEFDTLKRVLKEEKSQFAVSKEPKCYIETGVCTVTLQEDKFRTNLLYLPAGAFLAILWLGLGYEVIDSVIKINPIILTVLGSPLIYNGSIKITENFIFQNKKIAYGPCPSCEAENRVYFGDILGVEGFSDLATIKCQNCKAQINVQRDTLRASTLPK